MKRRLITDNEKTFIINKLTLGWTLRKIAEALDRPIPSIANIRRRYAPDLKLKENRGGSRKKRIDRDQVHDLIKAEKTDAEIADELDASYGSIIQIRLYELGIRKYKRHKKISNICPEQLKDSNTIPILLENKLKRVRELIEIYDSKWDSRIASICGVLKRSVQMERTAKRLKDCLPHL